MLTIALAHNLTITTIVWPLCNNTSYVYTYIYIYICLSKKTRGRLLTKQAQPQSSQNNLTLNWITHSMSRSRPILLWAVPLQYKAMDLQIHTLSCIKSIQFFFNPKKWGEQIKIYFCLILKKNISPKSSTIFTRN